MVKSFTDNFFFLLRMKYIKVIPALYGDSRTRLTAYWSVSNNVTNYRLSLSQESRFFFSLL